jgi:glutathione S-transferase
MESPSSAPENQTQQAQSLIPTLHIVAHSQAYRVHWALEELRLANPSFTYKVKHYARLRGGNPELAKVHPLGKSPVLTLETKDGSTPPTIQLSPGLLTESKLILEWLSEEYGNGIWTPDNDEDVKRDAFLSHFALSTFQVKADIATIFDFLPIAVSFPFSPIVRLLVSPVVSYQVSELRKILQILEDALSEEKPWFAGKKLGLSDINASYAMDVTVQRGWFKQKEQEAYPKLWRWCERVWEREAYRTMLESTKEAGFGYDLKRYGF